MAKETEKKKEEETQNLESPDPGPDSVTGGDDDDAPYEYQDPVLKDKSPQEIEALFKMAQQTVTGQKSRLEAAERRARELESKPPVAPAPAPEKKDFFADPDSAMERLEKRLEEMINPLKTQIEDARKGIEAQGLEERMEAKFSDWGAVRPWINGLLDQQNFPNPNDEGLLTTLYYTAKGMMLEQGALPQKKETKDVPNPDIHKGPIPQHRSSPPPPPPKKETKTEEVSWDDLDETEKVLCRSYKMTPKEFKEFQELNPEDVAESTIGQKEGA